MIALLLMQKILAMFLMMLVGFVLVRLKTFRPEESLVLSRIVVLLVMPCVAIKAFQIDYTESVRNGLLLALLASLIVFGILLLLMPVMEKVLGMNVIEQNSLVFTNCTNLLVPVISSVLGEEWVVYTFTFGTLQNLLIWSYTYSRMSGQKGFALKKLLNPNMISLLIGALLFFLGIRLPGVVLDACGMLGNTLGPLCMIVAGMLLGGMDLAACRRMITPRFCFTVFARLILCPLLAILLFQAPFLAHALPNSKQVLLVVLLCCASPTASVITLMAQVYGGDSAYANLLNVATTILCIVTIPLSVALYLAL